MPFENRPLYNNEARGRSLNLNIKSITDTKMIIYNILRKWNWRS